MSFNTNVENIVTSFSVCSEIFDSTPTPFADAYARRCFRVLRMVTHLHGKGFHGLRVFPYMYPLAYRIELFPLDHVDRDGVKCLNPDRLEKAKLIARHSGADGSHFFGWSDSSEFSADELAVKFVERFPELSQRTYSLDYAYAGWFATLVTHCSYGCLPYLFSEDEQEIGNLRLHPANGDGARMPMKVFPLPPIPIGANRFEPHPQPLWCKLD